MFFNDTATTEIYTLSLHDALPIWHASLYCGERCVPRVPHSCLTGARGSGGRSGTAARIASAFAVGAMVGSHAGSDELFGVEGGNIVGSCGLRAANNTILYNGPTSTRLFIILRSEERRVG